MTTEIARIESIYFINEYTELPNEEKINIIESELLRLDDKIDALKRKYKHMETLLHNLLEGEI